MDSYALWCQQDIKIFPIRIKCSDEIQIRIDLITAISNSKHLANYFSIDPHNTFVSLETANINSYILKHIIKFWYKKNYSSVDVHTLSDIVQAADYLQDEKTINGICAEVQTRFDLVSIAWATGENLNIMPLKCACLSPASCTHCISGFWAEVGRLVGKSPDDVFYGVSVVSDHISHGFI